MSIAIAKRLALSAKNGISERNLQYGSLKDPIVEEKAQQQQVNVNEELFYDTKGNVLEIKPYIFQDQQETSEEDSEEVKPKKSSQRGFDPAELNFDDIGYQAYEPSQNPRYVVVKNSDPVKLECKRHGQGSNKPRHQHKKDKSCGCYKDLVVDDSARFGGRSDSVSFESRFST